MIKGGTNDIFLMPPPNINSNPDVEIYDYIIVGAGSAGCVLANRLSGDPEVRVCLLEAVLRVRGMEGMRVSDASIMPLFSWGKHKRSSNNDS